ncbi:MAG: Metal-dependent hydrolase of the beta-lactamase superfamily [Capsulimonas sp.]|nr:Metal-dependent hydrolase of the beta-lactamase superfamily [Capsulimonas sp.]
MIRLYSCKKSLRQLSCIVSIFENESVRRTNRARRGVARAMWASAIGYNSRMRVTVLGSGTSHGVPVIGCDCAVCTSPDPKNKRLRPSIVVTTDSGEKLLVDTPPEMRMALLANPMSRLDAILYTHSHADHIFGLDDIRVFNYRQTTAIPIYAETSVLDDIQRIYEYIFKMTPVGGGKPQVELHTLTPGEPLTLGGLHVLPMRVFHGRLPILAYKFGAKFAYVTDVSAIPAETLPHLQDLDLLMLDAVRREPHETHFHLDAALEVVAQLKPKRTLLTHLSHDYDHCAVNAELPAGVELAYDGQTIDLPSA